MEIFPSCSSRYIFRLVFGSNQLYVFYHPADAVKQEKENTVLENITFEFAQEEIAENRGFDMNKSGKTSGKFVPGCIYAKLNKK